MSRFGGTRVAIAAVLAALVVATVGVVVARRGDDPAPVATVGTSTTTSSTTATTSTTTTAPPPPPTSAAPPPTTSARKPPPPAPGRTAALRGLGTWIDVYDWSRAFTRDNPSVGVAQVDEMAALGVQVLYVQTSKHESPDELMELDRLKPIIARARHHRMLVVGWYLPTFEDPARDVARLTAVAKLDVDAIGVDIESTKLGDAAERSRRLVTVSRALRAAVPTKPLYAIVMSPVVTDVINPNFWPGFPWKEIGPSYDGWMTMGYWTYRTAGSGWRDAYRYTAESISRVRAHLGRPDLPVHPIGDGGIQGGPISTADAEAYRRAVVEHRGLGGSLYDFRITPAATWPVLRKLRS